MISEDELISGKALAKRCASLGFALHGTPAELLRLVKRWEVTNCAVRPQRQGWTRTEPRAFLRPDGLLVGSDPEELGHAYACNIAQTDFAAEATAACDELLPLVRGNRMAITAICIGLSGPLLGLIGATEGFGLHLAGPSGIGKSTIGRLALSAWSSELMATGEATTTALLDVLSRAHHGLVVIDELRAKRGQGDVAYSMGNGTGRGRANSAGEGMEPKRTAGIALTTGEISAADAITATGDQVLDGQLVRHITIPLDGFKHGIFDQLNGYKVFEDLAAAISAAGSRHKGVLASRLIRKLCEQDGDLADQIKARVNKCHDALIAQLIIDGWPTDPKARRVLRNFALLLAAGEIAESFGIACWEEGELFPSIAEAARRALLFLRKPGLFSELATPEAELRNVRRLILMHVDAHREKVHVKGVAHRVPVDRLIGWLDESRLHLTSRSLAEIFCGEAKAKAAIAVLQRAGDLTAGDGRHIGRKLPTWTQKIDRALCIKRDAIGI